MTKCDLLFLCLHFDTSEQIHLVSSRFSKWRWKGTYLQWRRSWSEGIVSWLSNSAFSLYSHMYYCMQDPLHDQEAEVILNSFEKFNLVSCIYVRILSSLWMCGSDLLISAGSGSCEAHKTYNNCMYIYHGFWMDSRLTTTGPQESCHQTSGHWYSIAPCANIDDNNTVSLEFVLEVTRSVPSCTKPSAIPVPHTYPITIIICMYICMYMHK